MRINTHSIVLAVCLSLAMAAPAAADQCGKCAAMAHTKDIGECTLCEGMTTSGNFRLCMKCSFELGECERCRAPLGGKIDESRDGTYKSGAWEYRYTVTLKGTRSQGYHGVLLYRGKPVPEPAAINDHYQTPWGKLYWFGRPVVAFGGHGWMTKPVPSKPVGALLPAPKASRLGVFVKVLSAGEAQGGKEIDCEPWIREELGRLGAPDARVERDWFPLAWESVLLHDTKMYGRAAVRLLRSVEDKPLVVEVRNFDNPGAKVELPRKEGASRVIKHAVSSGFNELPLYLALRVGWSPGREGKALEIGAEADGKTVEVRGVDLVIVRLPGNSSTGFAWAVKSVEGGAVRPGGSVEYVPDPSAPALIGGDGVFEVPLRVAGAGKSEVVLEYARSWEADKPAAKSFRVTLDVREAPPADK